MKSRARILGHAIHPIMIVFPLGLLATAVIFDVIYRVWGNSEMASVSYWMMAAGNVGGLLAAPFGLIDWLAIPQGTRAKTIGAMHGLANVVALLFFAASWWMRSEAAARPDTTEGVIAYLGLAVAGLGGWLGGELVERLGVGVDDGANLDAPNSLTHETTRPMKGA